MITKFQNHIHHHFPELESVKVLVAVSGGLDSVSLVYLLQESDVKFELAHCNFNLRGSESNADEEFVKNLAVSLQVPIHIESFDTNTTAKTLGISTQMAARKLRYDWFDQLMQENHLKAVLTAHHLDDQIETFFINLNRGTGLAGLTGIPSKKEGIWRPLLPFTRRDIYDYAQKSGLKWREDSSNKSNKYQRNQLRNQVLPVLHESLPQLLGHFGQTLSHLQDALDIVDDGVARFRESVTTPTLKGFHIDIEKLKTFTGFEKYLFYLLQEFGFTDIQSVLDLMFSQTGSFIKSNTHVVLKDRESLILQVLEKPASHEWLIFHDVKSLELNGSHLKKERIETSDPMAIVKASHNQNVLLLDSASVEYPLTLRTWRKGDRMQPYGMEGSQLVSDILINNKVPLIDKPNVLVLSSEDDILWVLGQRTSNHHQVSKETHQILKITWLT